MAIHINSDKEKFRGVNPKLIGDNELTIRSGTGSDEKEILRTQLDSSTGLPRVGINRTGQRVRRKPARYQKRCTYSSFRKRTCSPAFIDECWIV